MRSDFPIRYAPLFDGVDDYISCPDHSSIQDLFNGGGTLLLWCQPRGKGDNNPASLAKSDFATKGWYFYYFDQTATTGVLLFGHCYATIIGVWAVTVIHNYDIPEFYRMAVTYDASSPATAPKIKVDGVDAVVSQIQAPAGAFVSDAGINLTIGDIVAGAGLQTYKGKIWDVCLENSVISDAELLKDWQENHLADSSFQARYKLNESNFPTDNAANSGSGGAGAGNAVGCVSENGYARFV